jgi:Zn-dependent protease with chaperone function
MNGDLYAKCGCQNCGTHIEFPLEAAGMMVDCPSCKQSTTLSLDAPPAAANSKPSSPEILNAFQGGVARTPVSIFYQLGLVLVTVVMVVLPLIYLAMILAAGWGVYYYAIHAKFLLASTTGGGRVYLLKLFAYLTPLFIGCILVLFMVKPLFARRSKRMPPLELNPGADSTLFAFIGKICDAVGAPMPKRIDLDCELNASASFRRGAASLFGHDLVLTIGLPLVSGLTMQELAGVIAHEFGHFTQGFGMRLSYIIRAVNGWFARVVYERDAWDVWLASWVDEAEDWRVMLVGALAHMAVGFSRLLLKLLMYFGHGICCFLLRQMEYDADSYEIKLAGSDAFERTAKRLNVLGAATNESYKSMRAAWNTNRRLPDNYPAFLAKMEARIPQETRTHIEDTVGMSRTGIFHTHPSFGDRIRRARRVAEPGIFHLDYPAMMLFANFEGVSKQVTYFHYTNDIGLPCDKTSLVPVETPG